MKRKLTTMLFLFIAFFSFNKQVYSQSFVNKDYKLVFFDKAGGKFESYSANFVATPTGNILISATFQLPKGHFLVPDKGVATIAVRQFATDIFGEEQVLFCITNINSSGRFSVSYHMNGAGNLSPNGWGIYFKL